MNHYREGERPRRTALRVVLFVICALFVSIGSIGMVVSYLSSHQPGTQPRVEQSPIKVTPSPSVTASTPTQSPSPTPAQTVTARQCKAGWPTSFTYDELGIKAPIEEVAMGQNAPDAPVSESTIGVVKTGTLFDNVTRPALPGDGYGNIIAEGHTYGDNSAVFKEDAGEHAAAGQTFYFDMDNGSRCEYQVTQVWTKLAKGVPDPGQRTFTDVATQEGFYEPHPGREQVLLMTCDDTIVDGHHIGELVILATPIN